MRYRLDVVASSVVDVVRFAGGWLFDRAMAGWDVSVLLTDLADHPDGRPVQALDHGVTEVTLWGETWPAELDDSVGLVQHRLSTAAQMFKAKALAAAFSVGEVPHASIGHIETFRSGLPACPSVATDLVPAG
jgi:hypothetical protein